MRTCPTCGRTVGDNVKFCPGCGSQMPQGNVCPACGRENREGMAFCRYCGVPLQGKAAPGEGALNRPQGLNPAQPQSQSQGQPQNWAQPMPGQTMPGQTMPGQAMSGQPMPGQQPNRTEPAPGGEKKPKKKMSRGKKAALFGVNRTSKNGQ